MDSSDGTANTPGATAKDSKPKRVRTGCLTCRERHLKCDETKPVCINCQKSNRNCVTGVKLNFQDIKVTKPPVEIPATGPVVFEDNSREIASEYLGGFERYPPLKKDASAAMQDDVYYVDMPNHMPTNLPFQMPPPNSAAHQPLPSTQGIHPDSHAEAAQALAYDHQPQPGPSHHHSHSDTTFGATSSYGGAEQSLTPNPPPRDFLDTQEEVLFMQVFVEEVGLWMDSMDPQKNFSRLLPFHALGEPMLLNAFLACGARHLALVNTKYSEDKALNYYDTATRYLLDTLQDPERNTVICATTAVILNVYEIMCERALQRMNHIAGARALIKECGWNAKSCGIGAACFWLNVGMELLSCLHFNWQVAWNPDDWGLDMNFDRETEPGREEVWTHRIMYIVAKVCNFRATIPRDQNNAAAQNEDMRLPNRYRQWQHLKSMADNWNECIPRTMHPMAFLWPGQTLSGSAFPEVWLIKRTSIVARLFYHTAMCLLAQINPSQNPEEPEMKQLQTRHATFICGISAHVKDRGVASVALRSLAIAAECLTDRREQEEVLQIFDKIRQETGWRVGFLNVELKEKWGWNEQAAQEQNITQNGNLAYQQQQNLQAQATYTPLPPPPPAPPARQYQRPPQGIINPIMAGADFSQPVHPYQDHYVPPNQVYQANAIYQAAHNQAAHNMAQHSNPMPPHHGYF